LWKYSGLLISVGFKTTFPINKQIKDFFVKKQRVNENVRVAQVISDHYYNTPRWSLGKNGAIESQTGVNFSS
jgi:hypothetical protein